jgi:hypothetical protein
MPPPPPDVQPPPLWGVEDHVREMFATAGVTPQIARRRVDFPFANEAAAADGYANDFGPFLALRGILEPQGKWPPFMDAFRDLIHRFNGADDGTASIGSDYLLITVDR